MELDETYQCLPVYKGKTATDELFAREESAPAKGHAADLAMEIDWSAVQSDDDELISYLVDVTNGGRFPLRGFRFQIGRKSCNHIEVKDSAASRVHALITHVDDRFFIDDLGSTNGTYLNGSPVTRRERLMESDEIKIGKTIFRFVRQQESYGFDALTGAYFSTATNL